MEFFEPYRVSAAYYEIRLNKGPSLSFLLIALYFAHFCFLLLILKIGIYFLACGNLLESAPSLKIGTAPSCEPSDPIPLST